MNRKTFLSLLTCLLALSFVLAPIASAFANAAMQSPQEQSESAMPCHEMDGHDMTQKNEQQKDLMPCCEDQGVCTCLCMSYHTATLPALPIALAPAYTRANDRLASIPLQSQHYPLDSPPRLHV